VVHDNEGGGYLATRHLFEHGHRRVACLTGPAGSGPVATRAAGWRRAVAEADADGSPLLRSDFDRYSAYRLAASRLSRTDRPSALFAATDELALGVLRAAAELGIAVPDELAVVGFDGIAETGFTLPPLTTVHHPIDALGVAAVDALFDGAAGRRDVVLPTTLLRRRSCGCSG
jgi:LacI family transcriptional regulator